MADGNFDPCECVCSSQWAVRRLLSILRTSQQYCTENECLTEIMPSPPGHQPEQNWQMMLFMMMWGLLMVGLFLTRPQSLRGNANKNRRYDDSHDNPPPDVPPVQ